MSESKRIEIGDQAASPVYTESEYQALKKEIVLLKQALDEQRARERERTAELKIAKDFGQLPATAKWSDVTISVRGKNFAVHRAILAARSSILANLLEANCKENCLEINDVTVDVFEALLGFIYTGKVPSLEPQMAKDLLAAADKYRLEQLKSIAEDYLCAQWSTESLTSLLSLAEVANSSKLKKCLELINSRGTSSTTPPISPFLHLPDLCLLALFRQLPPVDQMSARNTCHRWSILVPAANQSRSITIVFNRTIAEAEDQLNRLSHGPHWKLLKLLRKEDGSPLVSIRPLTKWNTLQFNALDEATVTQIMATFPLVRHLQLFAEINIKINKTGHCTAAGTTRANHLLRLIDYWHHQLVTLKLDVGLFSHWIPHHYTARSLPFFDHLSATINSMSTLKHLTIDLHLNREPFLPDLPILPQLTTFNTNLNLPHLHDMLHQYVPPLNSALTQISLGSHQITATLLASLRPDLRRRIVCFYYPLLHSDYRTICSHFQCLTSVWLELSNATVTLRDLLLHASQLTQLLQLQLYIDFPAIQPDDQPHLPLPQLTSVKLLRLILCNSLQSHLNLQSLNLPWTMPNLQVIDLKIYTKLKCTTCDIAYVFKDKNKTKHCLYQIFDPLKRACTQLHTIKHDLEERLGTAEEILAWADESVSPFHFDILFDH